MKKKITITEEQFKNVVKSVLENVAYKLNNDFQTSEVNAPDELNEMARINKKETGKCYFPFDSWELKIWSSDHEPAHFHVLKDGWNVSFLIENGDVLSVESKGDKIADYQYMSSNVKNWLSSKCFVQPKLTNRENAMLQWEQLH